MWRAFGMCAGIAFTVACGLSNEYVGPSGGGVGGIGPGGGNGSSAGSSAGGAAGVNGGQTGTTGANGGNGVNGVNGVGTTNGFMGTSNGNGNGPGGNGPGGNGPGGAVGSSSTGRFMGTNNGTVGGGNTTGGGGGCGGELAPCDPADGQNCCDGYTCTNEPSAGSSYCEKPCKKETDCKNAQTVCSGGKCVLNICGGSSSNGSYDGICSAGNLDGTCVPKGSGMSEYGICFVGGTTDAGCSETAPTTDPGDLCIAGEACGPNPGGPNEICFTLCEPGFDEGGHAFCLDAGFTGGCFGIGAGDLGVCFSL